MLNNKLLFETWKQGKGKQSTIIYTMFCETQDINDWKAGLTYIRK